MKQPSIGKSLAQYSAATAAFLAAHSDANAVVVYRDLDPDLLISTADTIFLDIDENGSNDIMFWIESKTGTITTSEGAVLPYHYRFAQASALSYNVLVGDFASNSDFVFNSIYQFSSGDYVGDENPIFANAGFLAGSISVDGAVSYNGGPWSGVENKFMAIRFRIDGYNHWAWLRVSVGEGGSFISVSDLAYDASSDIPVTAGITAYSENLQASDNISILSKPDSWYVQTEHLPALKTFQIFSLNGQLLFSETTLLTEISIPNISYPSGIYLLQITDETGKQSGIKILK